MSNKSFPLVKFIVSLDFDNVDSITSPVTSNVWLLIVLASKTRKHIFTIVCATDAPGCISVVIHRWIVNTTFNGSKNLKYILLERSRSVSLRSHSFSNYEPWNLGIVTFWSTSSTIGLEPVTHLSQEMEQCFNPSLLETVFFCYQKQINNRSSSIIQNRAFFGFSFDADIRRSIRSKVLAIVFNNKISGLLILYIV